jgi:putative nucleotidyltransferase with HDIG domain
MENMVSKERSRKARQRQKQAVKSNAPRIAFLDHPALGFSAALLACAAISFFMQMPLPLSDIARPETYLPLASNAIFCLAGLLITALLLHSAEPGLLQRNSRIILLTLILLVSAAFGRFIFSLADTFQFVEPETVRFLLPFTMAPLLATILLGNPAGLALGTFTSLLFAVYAGHDLAVLFTGLTASAVICHSARRLRTRSRVIRLAVIAGITQLIAVLGVTALGVTVLGVTVLQGDGASLIPVLHQSAACLAGALLSAVVVLLILPLLEHLFGITTDISLLEFSDLGHPLLQRLALEAPGTYHHSLVVANIAQSAAEAIGANSLEARVSSYFHDIGKLTKPNFFAENIHLQENPHDNLSPSMSTLIITSHVKEGLSLAMLHKMPEPVRRAIREHHGSSMLQCFHHKALNQLELEMGIPGNQALRIDGNCFRYPGPRPTTKVSGIICLADAVEAASRSLEKPTPAHIENLVNEIVFKRLDDGQLDECELSLLELSKIRKAFVFTLTTMLHGRIAYPKDEPADK